MITHRHLSAPWRFCLFILILIAFACDYQHGLHPVQIAGISGSITFQGDWPPETEWVRLVCFSHKPSPNNFGEFIAYLKGLSDPLPMNVGSYDYVMQLEPGTYEWIIVAWKAKGLLIISSKTLGEYSHTDSSGTPVPVTVLANQLIPNIDIIADFSKINSSAFAERSQ